MGRNWIRNARAAEGARSQPIDVDDTSLEYRDDVSKYTVSLNNTRRSGGQQGTTAPAATVTVPGAPKSAEEEGKGEVVEARTGGPADDGAQSEYFSALLNKSFCSHEFNLAG